jgi:probable rRNA maturation factor
MAKPGNIQFFPEGVRFDLKEKRRIRQWIIQAIENEKHRLGALNFIFTSDDILSELNQQYLGHTTLTDIITFDLAENKNKLEGDVYISIDRAKENAGHFKEPFEKEIKRLIIHGVLHLVGYQDKTKDEKAGMRAREEYYLSLLP